jgi:phospholipid/cholesterol/gamma-HCH transport system substrate-binding protein
MASAGRVKWAKFRVGAVFFASITILGALLYQLFGGSLLAPRAMVYLYVPDATGLDEGSPIRVDGIDVGKVSAVELSGSKQPSRAVRVTVSLQRDRLASIPADSVAQISSDSLVGDKFVDVTSGQSPKPISPEGEIRYENRPELLRSLDLTQFTQELRLLDATLTDIEQGRSEFGKFYQGQEFYNDLERRLRELQAGIRAAVSTTSTVGGLLNSDRFYRQASDVLTSVDRDVARLQSGQSAAGQLLRDSAQYDRMLAATEGFRHSVEELRGSEFLQSDRAYAGVSQWLAAMIQSVDELNRRPELNTTVVYDNLEGFLQEFRDGLRDFRQNPRKYLRMKLF